MDKKSWSCRHGIYYGCADCNELSDLEEVLATLKRENTEAREMFEEIRKAKFNSMCDCARCSDIKSFLEAKSTEGKESGSK